MVIKDRLVQACLWLICFAGMLWQFYNITDQFLKYETSTFVVIDETKEIIIPKLHLRLKAPELLIDSKTCNRLMYCRTNISDYYKNSTTINYYHTPSVEDIMVATECELKSSVTGEKVACAHDTMRRGSMNDQVIYSVHYTPNVSTIASSKFYDDPMLFSAAFNLTSHPHLTTLYVELYSKDSIYNWYDTARSHTLNFSTEISSAEYSYGLVEIHRLEYPYNTDCFDYRKIGFQSQSHCVANCAEYNYFKKFNYTVNLVYGMSKQSPQTISLMVGNFTCTSKKKYQLEISNHCIGICSRDDCNKQFFSPTLLSQFRAEQRIVKISVQIPNSPTTYITYMPRMNMIDLVTYVLSYISFWLGWSPLGFMRDIYVSRIRAFMSTGHNNEASDESNSLLSRRLKATIIRMEVEKKRTDLKFTAVYSLIQTFAHKT